MDVSRVAPAIEIDLEALREKYRFERDKRKRPEGEKQYLETGADLADFYETDPHMPVAEREPIVDEIEVAILGGGFAGLLAAANLRKRGVEDFRIIEMAGDFGGTWYWNRYPGVQCDVDSYCYFPLLEELDYIPKHKYAYGAEIYEHCQRIARHFDLYGRAIFHTIIRSVNWDADSSRWQIETDRGDLIKARHFVLASGPYNRPKLPGITGLTDFEGYAFHTSRWDYDYTGGTPRGGLVKLADKRVAVIGTGATGIQCIPFVGEYAKKLYVFQRTPSAIDWRNNETTPPDFKDGLKPGWQRERQYSFHMSTFGLHPVGHVDLIKDGWTAINRTVAAQIEANPSMTEEEIANLRELEDYRYQQWLRDRVDQVVENPATAEKLKAWYRFNCKRPTFNDEYLPTFNRPNVELIDVSDSKGVEAITKKGLIANGVEYEVDCIIFASGFEVTTDMKRRIGIPVLNGVDGKSLYDHWADGFRTLHGFMASGFPNMYFTGFIQGGSTSNVSHMYEEQTSHIAYIIGEAVRRNATKVEVTPEAEQGWIKTMRDTEVSAEAFFAECTPGYYNNEGGNTKWRSHIGESYGPGYPAFLELIEEWRKAGKLEGLSVS